MKRKPGAIVSESKPEESATNYNRWFRAEVEASLADTRPDVSHVEAMARIRRTIEAAARKKPTTADYRAAAEWLRCALECFFGVLALRAMNPE